MAYDLETREKARMMWLKGLSFDKIAETTGINVTTIFNWSVKYNWKKNLEETHAKVAEKTNEKLADDIDKMNQIHLAQLAASHTLIRDARIRVEALIKEPGKYKPHEVRALTGAMRDLTAALDMTLKNERLVRNVATEKKEITGDISWRDIIFESEKVLNEYG